jgi:hypothetical protein
LFNPKKPRPAYVGAPVDPSPLQYSAVRAFLREQALPAVPPVLELLQFLKQRIEQYQPEDYSHPTTEFLRERLQILKSTIFPQTAFSFKSFPNVPPDYEKEHDLAVYQRVVVKVSGELRQLDLHKDTTLSFRGFVSKNSFFRRLLLVDDVFTLPDFVLSYVPVSVEEMDARKGKPISRLFYSVRRTVSLFQNIANETRIISYNNRPKPKRYNRFEQLLRPLPLKKYYLVRESWMNEFSKKYLKSILADDPSKVCALLKTDGMGLCGVLALANSEGQYVNEASDLPVHAFQLSIEALLLKNPRPTPQTPTPKKTPTLFSDED